MMIYSCSNMAADQSPLHAIDVYLGFLCSLGLHLPNMLLQACLLRLPTYLLPIIFDLHGALTTPELVTPLPGPSALTPFQQFNTGCGS